MNHRASCALLVFLGASLTVHAANELGVYFDEAGTISHLQLEPGSPGFSFISVHVVLKNASANVSGFEYQFVGSPYRPGLQIIDWEFLGGAPCDITGFCDPLFWGVQQYHCACAEGSVILLETLTLIVWEVAEQITFDIGPLNCGFQGFSYAPCGCDEASCEIPLTIAADSEATISWGPVPVQASSMGAVKSLYE